MSAANTDNFIKTRRNFSTTIGSGGVADATTTTIPLASTTNLPTDTAVIVTINRIDANSVVTNNSETVVGVVSGTNLINCTRGVEGTAQLWASGVVVEILWNETNVNRMVTALLAEHNQDGTHNKVNGNTVASGTDTVALLTAAQTITNKMISGASNTLTVREADLSTSDVTTANVSTSKHGFAPKAPNDATKYLDGTGAYSTPASGASDGWTSDSHTLTYASATSVTISGIDLTTTYTKGTRVKFTNNSTTYYGTVASSSFSTNTTINFIGNSDFSIANSTITAPSYSYQANPQGWPGWFAYTPTFTGYSSPPASPVLRFFTIGNTITINTSLMGTGTSNSTALTISMPVSQQGGDSYQSGVAQDNSVYSTGGGSAYLSGSTLNCYKSVNQSANWTTSGAKAFYTTFSYSF